MQKQMRLVLILSFVLVFLLAIYISRDSFFNESIKINEDIPDEFYEKSSSETSSHAPPIFEEEEPLFSPGGKPCSPCKKVKIVCKTEEEMDGAVMKTDIKKCEIWMTQESAATLGFSCGQTVPVSALEDMFNDYPPPKNPLYCPLSHEFVHIKQKCSGSDNDPICKYELEAFKKEVECLNKQYDYYCSETDEQQSEFCRNTLFRKVYQNEVINFLECTCREGFGSCKRCLDNTLLPDYEKIFICKLYCFPNSPHFCDKLWVDENNNSSGDDANI